ncbi:MAG: GtrA family protein [Parvularculaceae bacterium]
MTADRVRRHSGAIMRFGLVGVGNIITEFAVFNALLHSGLQIFAANGLGFLAANIQSYVVNAHVTFRADGAPARLSLPNYGRFLAAHLLSLAISTVFIAAFAHRIGPNMAKLAAVGFGFVANYAMSALFVFRRAQKDDSGSESAR